MAARIKSRDAASKKLDHDATKDGKGKRRSRSVEATSTPAQKSVNDADAAAHSKKQMVQQDDGARRAVRNASKPASCSAVKSATSQGTREGTDAGLSAEAVRNTNAARKGDIADAKGDEDQVQKAIDRANLAKRDAAMAKAELEASNAEAERLTAVAEMAQAEAKIAQALAAIAQAEKDKATAAASMMNAPEKHATVQRDAAYNYKHCWSEFNCFHARTLLAFDCT
eukprot:CAMPEP_0195626420 /NCGR_PEP_ID=MMETSP0815-20121206/18376_1 /TAXON_ID=97485 /ORGANISM="Prymnesium parvum, Strain Texoma1" /LENGTH=225 /DNA_ID=CAMNT_0040767561 /DNA_START=162 /DNA_END=835 /DNA_ORIENTATION=-